MIHDFALGNCIYANGVTIWKIWHRKMMPVCVFRSCVIMHAINLASESPSECLGNTCESIVAYLAPQPGNRGKLLSSEFKSMYGRSKFLRAGDDETNGRWCEELITSIKVSILHLVSWISQPWLIVPKRFENCHSRTYSERMLIKDDKYI